MRCWFETRWWLMTKSTFEQPEKVGTFFNTFLISFAPILLVLWWWLFEERGQRKEDARAVCNRDVESRDSCPNQGLVCFKRNWRQEGRDQRRAHFKTSFSFNIKKSTKDYVSNTFLYTFGFYFKKYNTNMIIMQIFVKIVNVCIFYFENQRGRGGSKKERGEALCLSNNHHNDHQKILSQWN